MFRRQCLLTTGKLPKLQHVFSSKKHLIFRSYQQESLETYLTKRMIVKDEKVLHYYKHHIYNHILPYLLKHHKTKQASILQIQPSYVEVTVQAKFIQNIRGGPEDQDCECDDEPVEVDANTIFISKSLIYGTSLREMILKKDERLDRQFCVDLVGATVDFILGHNGMEDLMITSENIIVEDSGFFHLNYLSFVGLEFSKFDKYITRGEFQQILPFLTSRFIQEESPQRRSIDVWMELKFIMLNFYAALFKKDLIFDSKHLDLDVEVRRTDYCVISAVEKLENLLLPKLITQQFVQIGEIDTRYKVKYRPLMEEVLKSTKESRSQVTWEYILSNLSRNTSEESRSEMNNQKQQFQKYLIDNNEVRFAAHIFEVFDLYITLAQMVEQEANNIVEKNCHSRRKVFKRAKELHAQRVNLIQRQRYSPSLYIPIKLGMKFATLLKYRNWIDMLNSAQETDSSTLEALHKLIDLTIEIRQGLIALQPIITNSIISQLLNKESAYNNFGIDVRTLASYLQKISDEFKPISEEVESPTLTRKQKSLKTQFWQLIFWFLNQLLLLAKKFFLRVTARIVNGNMMINRNDFATIVQYIEEFTPPITVNDDS